MAIQSSLAGVARVAFEATGIGEFSRDVDQVERRYKGATDGMSDAAIRLEIAQERLRRSLAKGPAAAQSQARALLGVRSAERELAAETTRTTAATLRQDRALDQASRGAVVAGGRFRSLRSSIGFAAAGLVGGTGLVYGLRSVVEAAKEQELVLGQTKVALEQAGLSYGKYASRIESVIAAQSKLGFDDEALLKTFQLFVRNTGDVNEALGRNALAVDVARGRYISLEQAAALVNKAALGQAGALRRLGIDVDKNATRLQLLTALQEKFGGAAAAASDTATGASGRYQVAMENLRETIGTGLLPTLTPLVNRFADYADRLSKSEDFQRRANAAIKDGEAVLRGLAGGLEAVKKGLDPVIGALGGLENAVQLALIAGVVAKARRAASSFGLIAGASAVTRTKVISDSLAMGTALDVATRQRVVPVTVVQRIGQYGNPIPTSVPKPAPGKPSFLGGNAAALAAAVALYTGGDPKKLEQLAKDQVPTRDDLIERAKLLGKYGKDLPGVGPFAGVLDAIFNKAQRDTPVTSGPRYDLGLGALLKGRPRTGGRAAAFGEPGFRALPGSPTRPTGDGLSRLQRLQIATSDAQTTAGLGDDLSAARAEEAAYAKLASNQKLRGDKLLQARQNLNSAIQRRQGIEAQIAGDAEAAEAAADAAADAAQSAAQAKRDERAAKRKERAEKLLAGRRETLDLGVENASRTPGLTDDFRRQRALIGFLRKRLKVAQDTKTGVLAAQQELNTELDNLAGLQQKQTEREQKTARRQRSAAERAYRNQLTDAGFSVRNPNLVRDKRGGRKTATATTGSDKAQRERTSSAREDVLDKARRERATAQNLRDEFLRIVGQFDSNVHTAGREPGTASATGSTVVVNQHFNAPTEDRHREARIARFAAKAAFDG